MAKKLKVLIAGGGLGGLAAAIACAQRGFEVRLFEQAPALGEIGAGVSIAPSGFKVLNALGLKEQILRDCYSPPGREVLAWNTGYRATVVFKQGEIIARYGFPHIMIHRADLHAILVDALCYLQSKAIFVNAKAVSFKQSAGTVELSLSDGRVETGDVLVGADGIHSAVRRQLFGVSEAKFTGGIAWRGIIPMAKLPRAAQTPYRQVWLGVNGHFVVYPIRRGELINVVGHIERNDWQTESWTEAGTVEEMQSDFKGWHENVQTLIQNIDCPFRWALFLHPTLDRWTDGHVTLLGDACHPTLPYLGFGANMALEDGLVLARCLERLPGKTSLALKRYEELRISRTTRIVNESAANMSNWHHADLANLDTSAAYIDRVALDQRDSRDWLNTYDASTVELQP